MQIGEGLESLWYPPETSHKIARTILEQGERAFLQITPKRDENNKLQWFWSVPTEGVKANGGTPGGNDSRNCPPDCP